VLCCAVEAINTGPLEATIHNLGKEIEHKTKEGQELQRRWINKQTELVALQVGATRLAKRDARLLPKQLHRHCDNLRLCHAGLFDQRTC
jgi:flagellar biosynthesis chaperone FliJ